MKGRKPKPTVLRVLEGVPGHRPLKKHEPKPVPVGSVTPPAWLTPLARRYFKERAATAQRIGLFTEVDPESLAAWATACAQMQEASLALQATPGLTMLAKNGVQVARPEIAILRNAIDQVRQLGAEFGFTPSSRTRIQVKPPLEDDLDKLLGGNA